MPKITSLQAKENISSFFTCQLPSELQPSILSQTIQAPSQTVQPTHLYYLLNVSTLLLQNPQQNRRKLLTQKINSFSDHNARNNSVLLEVQFINSRPVNTVNVVGLLPRVNMARGCTVHKQLLTTVNTGHVDGPYNAFY